MRRFRVSRSSTAVPSIKTIWSPSATPAFSATDFFSTLMIETTLPPSARRVAPHEVRVRGADDADRLVLFVADRDRNEGCDPAGKEMRGLPLNAESVGDVPAADQDDEDRLLVVGVCLERRDRVLRHRGVPRALRLEHPLPVRVAHAGVHAFVSE